MKDAKGHGSNPRGGAAAAARANDAAYGPHGFGTSASYKAAHQTGVERATESPQSSELRLFADNDSNLHRQSHMPVVENLSKKMDKGVYDPTKAEKLWGYHADRAAQSYAKQFGGGQPWHKMFPTSVRREAASHWQRHEASRIKNGEYK